jgi:allophanate hydrolase
MIPDPLEIATIHAAYRDGTLTPLDLVTALLERIEAYPDKAVFISRVPAADLLAAATSLEMADLAAKPLFGIPFVAKDNIDVAGMWTTAACPDFAYMPKQSATVIEKLQAAGAILLGKANLDQFATGLNGTLWRAALRVRCGVYFRRVLVGLRGRRGGGTLRVFVGHGYGGFRPRAGDVQ